MGVPAPGQFLEPGLSTFSDDILKIELSGPSKQHLSVIDVPGIFRNPSEGVTTKEDIARVQKMVKSYIKDSRTIIMAVVPANVDIATQEILSLAEEADPQGQRTLGVLTKPDLVDRGAEEQVMDLVRGTKSRLNLGYCIVRNRGQQDMQLPTVGRHKIEKEFFSSPPWSALDREGVGIPALKDRLREVLMDITRREFPNVKHEIEKRLLDREQQLKALGPARETADQQRAFLLDLATKFQETTSNALDAYYGRSSLFEDSPSLRLATRIVDLNHQFSDDMCKKGHTRHFSKFTTRQEKKPAPEPELDDHSPATEAPPQTATENTPLSTTETSDLAASRFSELSDVIQDPWSCPFPQTDDIFDWIDSAYRMSRGFEMGTFNPSLLSILFQQQSQKWDQLALGYVSDIIGVVHSFANNLLSALCPDPRVQSNLWEFLVEDLLEPYQRAMIHTRFILRVERQGTPLTTNHYFSDNLQKSRTERINSALKAQAIPVKFTGEESRNMVYVDSIAHSVQMGNIEQTVEDIHAILKSYYKVARKRFVDVVCMQAADHFLVTGPTSPLRLFTPSFVHHMTSDQLNEIAGEDVVSKRRRGTLVNEIKVLKAAKKSIRG
jgi:Dynamin central region/Dynamin family